MNVRFAGASRRLFPSIRRRFAAVVPSLAALALSLAAASGTVPAAEPEPLDFNRQVKPLLAKACFACHGPDDGHREGGIRIDLREAALKKGETGAFPIVPGRPEESEILRRIAAEDDGERMPPPTAGEKLTPAQQAILKRWIAEGAEYAPHWAFVGPVRPVPPDLKHSPTPAHPIDRFIGKSLEKAGLPPAPQADRITLIRRLSLDLRGLPPTPAEVDAFLADAAPDAYERLVDRFLADPAYGERWARMWLDLARYADSRGYGSDPLRVIWRYRDWTIQAFNDNLPFDRFTIDQLAGDLLPNPTLAQRIATAFHRNTMTNTEGGTDDEEFRTAAVKDRVDVTYQVWMGLTMGCAKCHSHKFDPLSHEEYYRSYAIFNQTADNDQPSEAPTIEAPTAESLDELRRWEERLTAARAELAELRKQAEPGRAAWEARLRGDAGWNPLVPVEAAAEVGREGGSTTLQVAPDGTLTAAGDPLGPVRYVLEFPLPEAPLTALRLETLPDATLPKGGAGRADDGGFVLSAVEIGLTAPAAGSRPSGRFVRIELPGKRKMISLAEVQVFAGGKNVAVGAAARQSGTAFDGPPKLAVDGKTDGNYAAGSTTHTPVMDDPWWEVDLGEPRAIDEIVVWNRTDGGLGDRLAGWRIAVLDADRRILWSDDRPAVPQPSLNLSATGARRIRLRHATADRARPRFEAASLLAAQDEPSHKTGWGSGPEVQVPHVLTLLPAEPLAGAGRRLRVVLDHRFRDPKAVLGKFRLAGSTADVWTRRGKLPQAALAALDLPAERRGPEQVAALEAAFAEDSPALKKRADAVAQIEKNKPQPPTVPVMQELPPERRRKSHILLKGNFLAPGAEVSPGVPGAFHPFPAGAAADRTALARWIVDPKNPLTARVQANRFWAQLFGTGLVETEEDFGTQGELPSHPELLDWLATEFVRLNWDVKAFLKTIVLSETYRRSSASTPEQLAADPRNRLLARAPRYRLEAETVRDQALAAAGLLSRKMYGPSVFPPQPDGLWQAAFNGERTWKTSTGEDRYRRGLYVFLRRTVPYPSLAAFDAPSRENCTVRRIRTNTPLQAFVTLNDPVFVEAAQALGRRLAKEGGNSLEDRLRYGVRLATAHPATPAEVAELAALWTATRERYLNDEAAARKLATDPLGPLPPELSPAEGAAWTVVGNVLLNLDRVLTRN